MRAEFILHEAVNQAISALFDVIEAFGFALCGYAAPYGQLGAGDAVGGPQPEYLYGGMAAEIEGIVGTFGIGYLPGVYFIFVFKFAFVVCITGKNFPIVGHLACQFKLKTFAADAACRTGDGLPLPLAVVATDVAEIDNRAVFLIKDENCQRTVQTAFQKAAFPADFVVGAGKRRQELFAADVHFILLFENLGVAGIKALLRGEVIGNAGIRGEFVPLHARGVVVGIGSQRGLVLEGGCGVAVAHAHIFRL